MDNNFKLLIIGSGFIGKGLNKFYKGKTNVRLTNRSELDVCSLPSVKAFFNENNDFTHVIYAAGIKNIDFCETHPSDAFAVNSEALKILSLSIAKTTKMIYISTDYVFDGHPNSTGSFTESDHTFSTSIYGKSKLAGESVVRRSFYKPIIVRTSGVYGPSCGWVKWLMSAGKQEESIECYTDATNSPTHINSLAQMIIDVISSNYEGVINLVDSSIMNRHELYSSAFTAAGLQTNKLIESSRPTQTCLIPENVSLSNNYFCSLPSVKLPLGSPKFDFLNQMDKS